MGLLIGTVDMHHLLLRDESSKLSITLLFAVMVNTRQVHVQHED